MDQRISKKLALFPTIEFNYHLIRIELKKCSSLRDQIFFTFEIGGKISLFIKMDFFLICYCCWIFPSVFHIRKLPLSDVGMILEETTSVLLKSEKAVYEINASIVPKSLDLWLVLGSGSIVTWQPQEPSVALVLVWTEWDYFLSSDATRSCREACQQCFCQ